MSGSESPSNIFTMIRFLYPDLSRVEKRIADFFLSSPNDLASLTLADVSDRCSCGDASVIRFCRRIGCSGFNDAKALISSQLSMAEEDVRGVHLAQNEPIGNAARDIVSLYIDTLQRTMELNTPDTFDQAVKQIVTAGSIYLFGLGDAQIPCYCGYYRFRRIGIPCFFDADADMQLIHAANIRPGDVAIAISHSGSTRHVVRAVRAAKEAGAFVIGITHSSRSSMTRYCDLVFFNATSDLTVGKTIVAHRLAENTIMEVLYAGAVSQLSEQAQRTLRLSADIMSVNKEEE